MFYYICDHELIYTTIGVSIQLLFRPNISSFSFLFFLRLYFFYLFGTRFMYVEILVIMRHLANHTQRCGYLDRMVHSIVDGRKEFERTVCRFLQIALPHQFVCRTCIRAPVCNEFKHDFKQKTKSNVIRINELTRGSSYKRVESNLVEDTNQLLES